MYVCICKAVTESRIRDAVAEGATTLRDLRSGFGLGTGCGKCVPQAHEVLKGCLEERAEERVSGEADSPLYLARSA